MWAPSRAAFFYARPLLPLPTRDLLFIPFQGAPLRLLCAPSQAVHQTADVIAVVANPKLSFYQFRDARRSPQIGPISVGQRSLEQQADQTLSLGTL